MAAIDGVPLLLRAAEVAARRSEKSVSEILSLMDQHDGGQTVFVNSLRMATVEIEVAVVGVFSLFEARMQAHFPKGPFFQRLRSHLINEYQLELATKVHHYYLAVNVLKHGLGSSYEELLNEPNLPFSIRQIGENFFDDGDIAEPEGLIDVTATGFVDGLIGALSQTHKFLEC